MHLEDIGLVYFQDFAGFKQLNSPQRFNVHYYDKPLLLEMSKDTDNKFEVGMTSLTKIGQELAPICESKAVDGFYEYVKEQWKQYLPTKSGKH
jgi:hypothetical protein